ncbi:hypothetical protein Tco_0838782 [Tanacetum coccineum]|uniref:Reverse transcriptase n=1 Tax=Tanacetum coccineum TaxID=301880 RepID=A0ABQ5ANT3_9ASTR
MEDSNTAYFHKVVKSRATRNCIDRITASTGACADGDQVPMAFIDHYTTFLRQQGVTHTLNTNDLFCNKLSNNVANHMIRAVTPQEVRNAIFSMGNDKLPSPDGYRLRMLPVKYLGVPLGSSRLIYRNYKELVEKVKNKINDCNNKFLSFAGKVKLVHSVLASMNCHGDMRKGRAKVVWEAVCLPKHEGGLGIRRLNIFNKALITRHIWSIILLKDSLWV